MIDYLLTEEETAIRDLARRIAREKILPIRAELDRTGRYPAEVLDELARAGFYRLFVPEAYGGLGVHCLRLSLVVEEISRVCGGVAICFAVSALGTYGLRLFGTEEQKRRYLPDVAEGRCPAAFALTEAQAGSDAGAIRTRAVRDGDSYVLNGVKQWITNAGEARLYTVVAVTDPERGAHGTSAFLVEAGTPGMSFGPPVDKLGVRASVQREVILEDCRIPASSLLGREGQGFIVAMQTLDLSRPGIGAQALGIAQGALDEAAAYAKQREQFGKPISQQQAVAHMLADMATKVEASRALVYSVCRMIDAGKANFSGPAAMSKLLASDTAMEVTTAAVQIFGGYGYMRDFPVEKMMRDAKITQIYEGTNQIQRSVIAARLLRGYPGAR